MHVYHFERISEARLAAFMELFSAVHGVDLEPGAVAQKFNTEFAGARDIGYLAYSEAGAVAAYYGVFPVLLTDGTRQYRVAQSGDTMTHPEHRRRGLFQTLFERTVELARSEEIEFFFGFPNANSFPGFLKFGWTVPYEMASFTLFRDQGLFGRVRRRWLGSKGLQQRVSARGFPGPTLPPRHENGLHVLHNDAYAKYKCGVDKGVLAMPSGHAWVKAVGGHLIVGCLYPRSAGSTGSLVDELVDWAKLAGFGAASLDLSPGADLVSKLGSLPCVKALPLIFWPISTKTAAFPLNFCGADYDTF